MRALHEENAVTIGHLVDTRELFLVAYWRQTKRYQLTAFAFRRPKTGTEDLSFRCSACDQELYVRAKSAEDTRRLRRRYLAAALTGLAVAAVSVLFGLLVYLPLPEPLGRAVLVAFLVSLPVTGFSGWAWWNEDGFRFQSDPEHVRLY